MARRGHRHRKHRRPSTPRYEKIQEDKTQESSKTEESRIQVDPLDIQMISLTPKSALVQNKTSKKRRVTFADQDEIIVDKKARERSPDIYEPFEPISPPRSITPFVSTLETLTEDEDFEDHEEF